MAVGGRADRHGLVGRIQDSALDVEVRPGGRSASGGSTCVRERRRTLEFSSWAGPLDSVARVSQAGQWVGLELPAPARAHQIIPYGFTRAQENTATDGQARVDARYNITAQIAVYGTLDPELRHDRGRRRAGQPDPLRSLAAREAPVLSGRLGAVQPADSHVLLAPDLRRHRWAGNWQARPLIIASSDDVDRPARRPGTGQFHGRRERSATCLDGRRWR